MAGLLYSLLKVSVALFCLCCILTNTLAVPAGEAPVVVSSETIQMEHSFGDGEFNSRGKFLINVAPDGKRSVTDVDKAGIYEGEAQGFKKLITSKGLYQVRMKGSRSGSEYLYISMPVCALQASGFKEDILLHLTAQGQLVGAAYQSPIIGLPRACDAALVKVPTMFLTRIKIGEPQESMMIPLQVTAPRPPTLGNVNIVAADPVTGKAIPGSDEPAPAPQSFLRKYWYVALAMLIYTMLGPAEAPAASAGKKGGGPAAGDVDAKKKD
jgi:hypothetical protein